MATTSYDDFAARVRADWTPDVHEVHDKLAAQLEAEVADRIRLGKQLAALRRARHLTQDKLSALAMVGQSEISRIECGIGNPTTDTLTKLVTVMGGHIAVIADDGMPLDGSEREAASV